MNIAKRSQDTFKTLTAVGCSAFIFIEFVINIAMVLGLFPVVGMPLPFFSYGGSSLLTICIAVGILISIDRSNKERVSN
jgi:rod shape determining protein RodA